MSTHVDRRTYNALYGPTTGDRIRLGDTGLWVEVETDDGTPGDELLGGCGKTVRDEMKFVFCERVDDVAREALGIELNSAVTAAA